MKITPIDGSYGVEVHGCDLIAATGDDDLLRQLAETLYANRVVVVKGQSLDKDAYCAFGKRWGEPIPHVISHLRMKGYPEIFEVGNTTTEQKAHDSVRNGAVFWHTDQSYEAVPSSATMLYAIEVPEKGGETLIADMAGAWDDLPAEERKALDALEVSHLYGAASGRGPEKVAVPLRTTEQIEAVPEVVHPLVMRHPMTGRKALYAVAGTPTGVNGLAAEKSADLLERLKTHALQPQYIYSHRYEPGDVLIYDTTATLHSGVPIDAPGGTGTRRTLWRISVRGTPEVFH